MILREVDPGHSMRSYRHYKGGTYTLLIIARSSETRDELQAVYVSHQTQKIWVRPWTMFTELVTWPDGVRRPRFTELSENEPATLREPPKPWTPEPPELCPHGGGGHGYPWCPDCDPGER